MAGTVIQKAIIEVKFDDLNKAQLALKSTGVEMIAFGETAKKSTGGTKAATRSIGDLSMMLDKKLENGLGKAFKATDRLSSIMGSATAAMGVVGIAISVVVGAYKLLTEWAGAAAKAQDELAKAAKEKAAEALKALVKESDKAADSYRELAKQIGVAGSALMLSEKLAASDAVSKLRAAKAADDAGFNAIQLLKARTAAKAKHVAQLHKENKAIKAGQTVEEAAAIANAWAKATKELKKLKGERIKTLIIAGRATDALRAEQKAFDALAKSMGDAFNPPKVEPKVTPKGGGRSGARSAKREKSLRQLADEWDAVDRDEEKFIAELRAELEALSPDDSADGTAFSDALFASLDAARDKLDPLIEGVREWVDEVRAATKYNEELSDSFKSTLGPQVDMMGNGLLSAAFDAAVYSDSMKDAFNDVVEVMAKEAGIQAMMELAKGLAMSLINPPGAAVHYGAAAAFAAVAGTATGLTMATGGFNGPAGAGGGDAEDAEAESDAFTGGGDTGQDRSEGRGTQETTINLNLTAGSRPLLRIEQAQMAQELRGIMGA